MLLRNSLDVLIAILSLAMFVVLLSFVHLRLDAINVPSQGQNDLSFPDLPSGKSLKMMALGYNQLVSSLLWLKIINVAGTRGLSPAGYEWLYQALDRVTTLDPQYEYAYQFAAINLTILGNQPEKSNQLLYKGLKKNPQTWYIPFYIGFTDYYYLGNYQSAAENMARAASISGRPEFVPDLAAGLFVEAKEPGRGMAFLEQIARSTDDERIAHALRKKAQEIRDGKITGIFHK